MKKFLSTHFGRVLFLFLSVFASQIESTGFQTSLHNIAILLTMSTIGGLILWPLTDKLFHYLIMKQAHKNN